MGGEIARRFADNAGQPTAPSLTLNGPALHVEVRLAPPAATREIIGGGPLPQPMTGAALIDTGASHTCIDIRALVGAHPIRSRTAITPAGLIDLDTYAASLRLPEVGFEVDFEAVTGIDLANLQTEIDGTRQPVIALIGRDLLERCVFVYDGPGAEFTLSA